MKSMDEVPTNYVRNLAFSCESPVRTYLYAAFPMGILEAEDRVDGLVLSHHMQLFFPNAKLEPNSVSTDHVRLFPGFGFDQFSDLGYFKIVQWAESAFGRYEDGKEIEKIGSSLDRGNYVYLYINNRFVPKTESYLKYDRRHELLLTGCRRSPATFVGMTYLADGSFGPTQITVDALRRGIFSPRGRAKGGYASRTMVREIALLSGPKRPAAIDFVIDQLSDYFGGKNNGDEYLRGKYSVCNYKSAKAGFINNGNNYEEPRHRVGAFGIATYEQFAKYVVRSDNSSSKLDLRISRIFMEHKAIMLKLLPCVVAAEDLNGAGWVKEQYAKIYRAAHLTHFAACDYNEGRCNSSVLLNLINETKKVECETIGRVLADLRGGDNTC